MNIPSKSTLAHVLMAALFVVMPLQQAQSAPGTLPSIPMYLSTAIEPNIFFTLDDSKSMNYVPIMPSSLDGRGINIDTANGLPIFNGSVRHFYNPQWSNMNDIIPPVALYPEAWAAKSKDANVLYYDPDVTYTPWAGISAATGLPYIDAGGWEKWAPRDPNNWTSNTVDLTKAMDYNDGSKSCIACLFLPTYYIWVDNPVSADGILHATDDTGTEIVIKPGNAFPSGRSYMDEMQNFANWFVYYRSRSLAMRAGIGKVIYNSTSGRMGLDVFVKGHQVDAATMSSSANKRALLDNFYNMTFPGGGGTPARKALQRVGELFAGNTGNPSPIESLANGGDCQQNFNILLTDGYYTGGSPGLGNTDYDGSGGTDNGFDGDANESVDDGNYGDSYSNTLADVAMHYYETDLSTLPDNVPIQPGIDEATHQHLVTYTIAYGVDGTLDPATQDPTDAGFAWPDPTSSNAAKIDDLWHAAYNARGSYMSAQNAEALANALGDSLIDITQRSGITTAVAANSTKLNTNTNIYLAQFNSAGWQGTLQSFQIIDLNTGELAATPTWDAGLLLTARDIVAKPRTIITYDKSVSVADGVPFQWTNLSTSMQADLTTNPAGGTDTAAVGAARLDFIRGDRSNEGSGYLFRERSSIFGDIVNSGPVFVGAPDLTWPDYAPFPTGNNAYSVFKNGAAATRPEILYFGANDGMLHGIDDKTGQEVFAYVPGGVYSQSASRGLHYLTDPNYLHQYYVDLTPSLSDVFVPGGGGLGGNWTTVLIGGLRSGGRGYFALDVTNPSTFSEAKAADTVLWEFTSDDDADLGYTYSRPFIGLANDGSWVAIFGNGYNDTGSGEAQLFIVDIAKGIDGTWDAGDYRKITTGVGTPLARNGLATPALADLDGNGTIDRVYAGDLQGNMWAFDLSSANPVNWASAYKSGSTPSPLFTTQSGEPITAKPVLASHPTQPDSGSPSNAPNIMVYFGSGQFLVDADKSTTNTESFYGVWDTGDNALDSTDLIQQTFDTNFSGRVLTRNPVDYSLDHGWYFDLDISGERAVTSPIARSDTVFFNTYIPQGDPCGSGGFGYKFAVDMVTGGSPLEPAIDSNNDGVIDDNDYQNGGGSQSTLAAVYPDGYLPEPTLIEDLAFTADQATKVKALLDIPSGRFSWLELLH